MNRPPIIQPGQINIGCEHRQDPGGNDPAQPVTVHTGSSVAVIGGLTCREEIASRILAGLVQRYGEAGGKVSVDTALQLTDDLLAKTRPQPEPEKADGA